MRYYEILEATQPQNSLSAGLKKQADAKKQQAKNLQKQSKIQKKREDIARLNKLTSKKMSQINTISSQNN